MVRRTRRGDRYSSAISRIGGRIDVGIIVAVSVAAILVLSKPHRPTNAAALHPSITHPQIEPFAVPSNLPTTSPLAPKPPSQRDTLVSVLREMNVPHDDNTVVTDVLGVCANLKDGHRRASELLYDDEAQTVALLQHNRIGGQHVRQNLAHSYGHQC